MDNLIGRLRENDPTVVSIGLGRTHDLPEIPEALRRNTHVREIELDYQSFDVPSAATIASALARLRGLRKLQLIARSHHSDVEGIVPVLSGVLGALCSTRLASLVLVGVNELSANVQPLASLLKSSPNLRKLEVDAIGDPLSPTNGTILYQSLSSGNLQEVILGYCCPSWSETVLTGTSHCQSMKRMTIAGLNAENGDAVEDYAAQFPGQSLTWQGSPLDLRSFLPRLLIGLLRNRNVSQLSLYRLRENEMDLELLNNYIEGAFWLQSISLRQLQSLTLQLHTLEGSLCGHPGLRSVELEDPGTPVELDNRLLYRLTEEGNVLRLRLQGFVLNETSTLASPMSSVQDLELCNCSNAQWLLARLLGEHPWLARLALSEMDLSIGSEWSMTTGRVIIEEMVEALPVMVCQELVLYDVALDRIAQHLAALLSNPRSPLLRLGYHNGINIDSEWLLPILEALVLPTASLEQLDLWGNNVDVQGLYALADYLPRLRCLRKLAVMSNPYITEAIDRLMDGLRQNESLVDFRFNEPRGRTDWVPVRDFYLARNRFRPSQGVSARDQALPHALSWLAANRQGNLYRFLREELSSILDN